jgi:hypothetical protein
MRLPIPRTASRLWRDSIPWRVSVIVASASTGMLMIAPATSIPPGPAQQKPVVSGATYTPPATQVAAPPAAPPPSPFATGVGPQPQSQQHPPKPKELKIAPGLSGVQVDLQRSEMKPDQKQEFGTFKTN